MISCAAAMLLAACAAPPEGAFEEVRPGMTRAQVVELLGEPSSRMVVPKEEIAMHGYAERYAYGDSIGSFATQLVFRDQIDSRVWTIFFDADGVVVDTRPPEPEEFQPARRFETIP